jgi:hypothetical protein
MIARHVALMEKNNVSQMPLGTSVTGLNDTIRCTENIGNILVSFPLSTEYIYRRIDIWQSCDHCRERVYEVGITVFVDFVHRLEFWKPVKHKVSETGRVSDFRPIEEDTYFFRSLGKS